MTISVKQNYCSAIDRIEMTPLQIRRITRRCQNRKTRRRESIWIKAMACALILCVVIGMYVSTGEPVELPLVITAYAIGDNGEIVETQLQEGEKVYLHPGVSNWDPEFYGYVFDLSLTPGTHISLYVTDAQGNPLTNTYILQNYGEFFWSLTQGDDISFLEVGPGAAYLKDYANGKFQPKPKGKNIIWKENIWGQNYNAIVCYDSNFYKVCTYFMGIEKDERGYYARILRIEK